MTDDVLSTDTSEIREREQARRNALQEEILRPAYRRGRHRAHVEAALSRSGYHDLTGQPSDLPALPRRVED